MKDKNKYQKHKTDYSRLKRKMLFQLLCILVISLVIVIMLHRLFIKNNCAEWITLIFHKHFHIDYDTALKLYQTIFRNNLNIIEIIATSIIFFILLYILLGHFFKYFDIVNQEIDALLEDEAQIQLPSEMSFLEQKLNTVKQVLKQRSMEAELAEQRKNDLVIYLAHDIRTPLTSVIGYLNLLQELPDMPVEQRAKSVNIALDKAHRLEMMINEFFEITKYNLQQISLKKENIDLYYMLVQLTDELSPLLSANGNTAILEAHENLTIYGDSEKLARIFNNILKNAAAYSYPDTEILISAKEENDCTIISFQNKGDTIPKEKLSLIFEKFYRLDEARTTNTGGTGLGLAIAKEIVTAHGGTITVNSKNNVTTFIVTIPAACYEKIN